MVEVHKIEVVRCNRCHAVWATPTTSLAHKASGNINGEHFIISKIEVEVLKTSTNQSWFKRISVKEHLVFCTTCFHTYMDTQRNVLMQMTGSVPVTPEIEKELGFDVRTYKSINNDPNDTVKMGDGREIEI